MEDWAIMVVAIVAVTTFAGLKRARYKHDERMRGHGEGPDTVRRLDALEERIKVLETIVTDRNYELKREIDDLGRA